MEGPMNSILIGPSYKGELPYNQDREEVIALSSADPCFYDHYFFGKAFRQEDPPYARQFAATLEHPDHRYVAFEVFRGGAKTTRLRSFISKRIAFGISRTVLYIGKSDDHAERSVNWIRKAVMFNQRWTDCFGISKGTRFNQGTLEIEHAVEDHTVYVTAAGITGSVRGINFDDYRPDLIVCDDIIDRESVSTARARKKITELVHGDIKESLEAETDNPHAKLVILETPLDEDDPGEQARRDPLWKFFRYSCWTPETEGLDVDQQVSSWPARYPTLMLRKEKKAAAETNKLYVFTREKECKLISPETASFKEEWLQFYETLPPRDEMDVRMWIDPVPPPSEKQILEGLAKKDYEALAVVGKWKDRFYVLEIQANRGHEPDWTISTFFRLIQRWRPRRVGVESTAYQRTLASLLKMAMQHRRQFVAIDEDTDRRSKLDKISDGLHGPASNRRLYVRKEMTNFISQFARHPDIEHDDELESVARCVEGLNWDDMVGDYEDLIEEEDDIPLLGDWRACP